MLSAAVQADNSKGSASKDKDGIECDTHQSYSPDRIVACIKKNKMIQHMKDIQSIADNNPDVTYPDG